MLKLDEFFRAIETGKTISSEEHFARLFKDAAVDAHDDDYPDVYKELFFDLIKNPEMNSIRLKLLLIAVCKGALTIKM